MYVFCWRMEIVGHGWAGYNLKEKKGMSSVFKWPNFRGGSVLGHDCCPFSFVMGGQGSRE